MSTIGPEIPGQALYAVGSLGKPPSCTQHHDRLDAALLRAAWRAALAVSTSSVNFRPCDPGLGDDVRGVLERHADEADLHAAVLLDRDAREDRLAGVLVEHVGREVAEVRALERVVRAGVLVVLAVRAVVEAAARLHPHQLAPALVELVVADAGDLRPILFIASIVGSSWNAADSSGVAPIRSPAATVTVCRSLRPWPARAAA